LEEDMKGKSTASWVLALTSVASLMVALDATVVATALSSIRQHLGATITQLEWTTNAYSLSFAVLLMSGAALGDRFGRRTVFALGLGVFSAASAACALSPDVGWLIAMRAVQGVGAALVMPNALALLGEAYPPERRGWALGVFAGVTGLAVLGGPVVGGAITQGIAWQWIFWLNVPIGVVAIILSVLRIRDSRGFDTALDIPGLLLVTGAGLGLVWGLVRGNSAGWGSFEVLSALIGGAALTVGFVLWELRASAPMLPMRFFRSRAFSAGNASVFLLHTSLFGAVFFMAQFQQVSLGQGPLASGLRLLPWTGTLFVVAPKAGELVDRIGERPLIVAGLLLQGIGFGWISLIASPSIDYVSMVAPMVIAGAGVSMAYPAVQKVVVGAVAPRDIGKASGSYNTMRQLGGVFGVAILVAIFSGAGGFGSPQAFSDGFAPAMAIAALMSFGGTLTGMLLPAASLTIPAITEVAR
jgi:EmrB/QacA subfamily drug resistance transporter